MRGRVWRRLKIRRSGKPQLLFLDASGVLANLARPSAPDADIGVFVFAGLDINAPALGQRAADTGASPARR